MSNSKTASDTATARDLEDVRIALYAIRALAHVLGLDPAHEFDRTAIAELIEREAGRASAIVDALLAGR